VKKSVNAPNQTVLCLLLCASALLATAPAPADPVTTAAVDKSGLPPDAPGDLKGLIGEYSSGDARVTVYEAGGQLHADGLGLRQVRLRRLSATTYAASDSATAATATRVEFTLAKDQPATAVVVAGTRLPRRDIDREIEQSIQAAVKADPERLRRVALAAQPPSEPPPKRAADLVDLSTVDPTIKFDIRYATSNNFIGFPLYERSAAYLQRPAAEALGRVQRALAAKGYGLLIHDAYRPWFVTKMFWDATPEKQHVFVADPSEGSRHNRGCAVDLTLYDLKTGHVVEMPGRYDEMSPRSYADYVGGTSRERWLRDLLRSEMESQGFTVYPPEWWHFDYKDWKDYAIGTATFSELASGMSRGSR
jgi:D-alanyl-D-alanine dipeptidase